MNAYESVRACAIAMLRGTVLQAHKASAGRGMIINWREVKCGETMLENGDAFEVAYLFVALVGADAALATVDEEPAPAFVEPKPHIVTFMQGSNGGRRRQFDAGEFRVVVEPHENDDAQAAFTERLAALASQ